MVHFFRGHKTAENANLTNFYCATLCWSGTCYGPVCRPSMSSVTNQSSNKTANHSSRKQLPRDFSQNVRLNWLCLLLKIYCTVETCTIVFSLSILRSTCCSEPDAAVQLLASLPVVGPKIDERLSFMLPYSSVSYSRRPAHQCWQLLQYCLNSQRLFEIVGCLLYLHICRLWNNSSYPARNMLWPSGPMLACIITQSVYY